MKILNWKALVVCVCMTACLPPACLAAPGGFDQSGMPTSRYSAFEVRLLQSLSATQRQEIDSLYAKADEEKIAISQELIELFRQEVADYPELATKAMNDDNPIYKAMTSGQYQQFQSPRWNIYAEEAQNLKTKTSVRQAAQTPVSVEEYHGREQALAQRLEKSQDDAWALVKSKLTQAQLQELGQVRGGWNASSSWKGTAGTTASAPRAIASRSKITPIESTEEAAYVKLLYRNIRHCWFPPKGKSSYRPRVSFTVSRTGEVYYVRVTQSSGDVMADTCAVKAVQDARHVRRVAPGVPDYMNFEMDFDFNGSGPGLIPVHKSSH